MIDQDDLKAAVTLGGISAMAATCRIILSQDEKDRTFIGWASLFVLSMFAGEMVWYAIHGQDWDDSMKVAVCLASALSAKELLLGIIKIGETIRDQSSNVAKILIDRKINKE